MSVLFCLFFYSFGMIVSWEGLSCGRTGHACTNMKCKVGTHSGVYASSQTGRMMLTKPSVVRSMERLIEWETGDTKQQL